METENPVTEHNKARYLGKTAVYPFCVSSVAMPSSSSYKWEVSLGALSLASDVALLKSFEKAGTDVKNTSTKAVKPAMEEGLGERSMRDKPMTRKRGSGEQKFLPQGINILYSSTQRLDPMLLSL